LVPGNSAKFGDFCPDRDQGSPGNVMGPIKMWG
jgi:hypothetical protein